jgi:hypothetical protein
MKSIQLLILLLSSLVGFCQNNFMTDIGNAVKDSNSQFYYPTLLEKVKSEPQNLTVEDCKHLYYGQLFQEGDKTLTMTIPGRMEFDQLTRTGKCKKAVGIGFDILKDNPVELTTLLHTISCMDKRKNEDSEFHLDHRFRRTLDAILSTGDGRTLETAIQLVNLDDDLIIKGILGFLGGDEQLKFENERSYSVWTKGAQSLYFEDVFIEK